MSLVETLASQNQLLKGLVTKVQWGTGRCASCDSNQAEGHTKHCELARILEDKPYRFLGHPLGRPTTLPGVWGQMANALGGVAKLAEEFGVTPKTLQRWAYCERRPSRNDIAHVQALVTVCGLRMPVLKYKSIVVGTPSGPEETR